jgi:hypothetical protein
MPLVVPVLNRLVKRSSQGTLARQSSGRFYTNLILRSEEIDNASWVKSGLAATPVLANNTTAPDGTVTADKIIEAAGGTFHLIRQDVANIIANSRYTLSCFLKGSERTFTRVQISNTGETSGSFIDINLTTGATGTLTNFGTGALSSVAVSSYPNGFWRVALTSKIDSASTSIRCQLLLASALGTVNYAGDGTSGLFAWGAALESGFGTNYIKTISTQVTQEEA